MIAFHYCKLKDTHRKKDPKKLQRLRKVWIWRFGSLANQINSFKEVLQLKQKFKKNKVVTGKTSFFVIGPLCTHHSVCLNIGFWYDSFIWKCWVFNLGAFKYKTLVQFFEKDFLFPENLFQSLSIGKVQNFHRLPHKNMPISQTESYFENPWFHFLEEPVLFLLVLNWNLLEKALSCFKTKTNSNSAVKPAERSNHLFLLSTWWITLFKDLYLLVLPCFQWHHMLFYSFSQSDMLLYLQQKWWP